jgi:hypothetical protein
LKGINDSKCADSCSKSFKSITGFLTPVQSLLNQLQDSSNNSSKAEPHVTAAHNAILTPVKPDIGGTAIRLRLW